MADSYEPFTYFLLKMDQQTKPIPGAEQCVRVARKRVLVLEEEGTSCSGVTTRKNQ